MKKEMEEIPDELNPDLMLNTIASELLIKIAKGEIDIQKDQIEALPFHQADGLFSRTGRHHIHPIFLQHVGDQQKNGHIVVHQKYISVHFHAPFFLMIPQSDRGGP